MITPWKTLASKLVFETPWFQIFQNTVKLHTGKIFDNYYIFKRPEVAIIIAQTIEGKILCLREYKYGANKILIGLPAGCIEAHEDDFAAAAKRELLEETGYIPKTISKITDWYSDATSTNARVHVYLATGCEQKQDLSLDQTEQIEVFEASLTELQGMVRAGEIENASVYAALGAYYTHIKS
jgi:ADP-ribose pyrophosphatase